MKATRFLQVAALTVAVASSVLATGCSTQNPNSERRSSVGQVMDDTVITSKVKAAFVEDKAVSPLNINVETYQGTVQLSGFANSMNEIDRAVSLTREVKGVKAVKNDIRLKNMNSAN